MDRIALLLALAGMLCLALPAASADERPNVVFLLVDDLGWTDVGCFGSDLYRTPNINRLAARGMKFTDGYAACTVCSPTRAAAMTGMYPARVRVTDFISGHARPHARLTVPDWTKRLEHRHVTIAEALRSAGYATAQVGKWHLAPRDAVERWKEDRAYFAHAHGFDLVVAGTCHNGTYYYPFRRRGYDTQLADTSQPGDYITDRLTDEALEFIDGNRDRPFFLYFSYFNVHTPVEGKPEYVQRYRPLVKPGMRHTNPDYDPDHETNRRFRSPAALH